MNIFAGSLRFGFSEGKPDEDGDYFQKLQKLFPSAFSQTQTFSSASLSLTGNVETAVSGNGPHQLFFSGAIFNRDELASFIGSPVAKFQNNADLLLALFLEKGMTQVKKVNGQFIIVYLDKEKQKIHIINDHLGIQQFFYYQDKDLFLFGSQLKYLLAHPACPKEIDWETSLRRPHPNVIISEFRSYKTWFKEISLMPEASIFELDLLTGQAKTKRYWGGFNHQHQVDENDTRTAQQVMDEYMALLDDAVKIRIADEPTGYSFLSGGLDSSIICALAAKYKPLETFSIITRNTCLEDTTSVCNQLAGDLNIKNSQFLIPIHEFTFNSTLWKQRIWRAETPVNHTDSFTKTMLHYAIRKKNPDIRYLLTGTGSDQLNGGLVRWVVNDSETKEASWENFIGEIMDGENKKLISRVDDGLWSVRKFLNRDFLASVSGNTPAKNPWMIYVNSSLHIDMHNLMWDEARAASSNGHTMRFPFMDYRFVEFIANIPPRLHQELFYDKPVLREPSRKYLPDYVVNKQKMPVAVNEYDIRFRLFDFLTSENGGALLREALGDIDEPHPVINKKALMNRIEKMKKEPEIMEWLNIMHIINLGLLEKLPGKSEADLDYESALEVPMEMMFDNPSETKKFLEKRLSIKTMDEIMNAPLQFSEGCSFLFDKLQNKFFLSKKNIMVYEIEEEYKDWKNFLSQIDNKLSTNQILAKMMVGFEAVEEFFKITLQEQILTTSEKVILN